jgi:hypothetical protein
MADELEAMWGKLTLTEEEKEENRNSGCRIRNCRSKTKGGKVYCSSNR